MNRYDFDRGYAERQDFLCSGLDGLERRADIERCLTTRLVRPLLDDIMTQMVTCELGMMVWVYLEATPATAEDPPWPPPDTDEVKEQSPPPPPLDPDYGEEEEALCGMTPDWVVARHQRPFCDGRYKFVRKPQEDGTDWEIAILERSEDGGWEELTTTRGSSSDLWRL